MDPFAHRGVTDEPFSSAEFGSASHRTAMSCTPRPYHSHLLVRGDRRPSFSKEGAREQSLEKQAQTIPNQLGSIHLQYASARYVDPESLDLVLTDFTALSCWHVRIY